MMTAAIPDDFYLSLYPSAEMIFKTSDLPAEETTLTNTVKNILASRQADTGLSSEHTAQLLHLLRSCPDQQARDMVISAARDVRQTCFGGNVATMVPIEVTSYCASTCKFCGWRADNKDMVRLAITEEAIRKQARILAQMGFSHFEIAGGDHLPFLKNNLKGLVAGLKQETREVNPQARVSLCLVPMHESQYAELKEHGLDCVLTWQETYKQDLYNYHIPSGPKAWGIDTDFNLTRSGNGFLQRLKSQEMAIRAGLQAGMGAMIGLAECTEADILSVILHGQKLLGHYADQVQPLIIGMPAWNAIPTESTDNREALSSYFDVENSFELIAAIYLLAFPNRHAWIFANGRVAPNIQTNSVVTASCFTSTLVQIAPGAYLDLDETLLESLDKQKMFAKSSIASDELTQEKIMSGEQFMHYLLPHDEFVGMFMDRGLNVVPDQSMLLH